MHGMNRRIVFHAALLLVFAGPISAHHSLSGVYDTAKQVRIEGVVREFQFVNPHPFVHVEVRRSGKTEVWKIELDNRYELTDIGMSATTLKPGERVTVSGNPGRSQERIMYVSRMDFPQDGFWYEQVGSEPKIGGGKR
jgi:hypothetical protein